MGRDGDRLRSLIPHIVGVLAKQDLALIATRVEALEQVIYDMQLGPDCWCQMAIGNPMFSEHSPACQAARRLLLGYE